MPTNTTNLSLKKPIVGADEDLWGGYINDNLDDLDAYLSGNSAIPALDVTGDLTVDTNTLYVDSTNNRVGIGTISPSNRLTVRSADNSSTTDIVKFETANATAGFKFGYDRIEQINALSPMTFYTGGSESARIDVSGNLIVGTTNSSPGVGDTNTGVSIRGLNGSFFSRDHPTSPTVWMNKSTYNGTVLQFLQDGVSKGNISVHDAVEEQLGVASVNYGGLMMGNRIQPMWSGSRDDNILDMGSSTYRFDDIYATNGSINTSDGREKQDIAELDEAERRVAQACKGLLRKFRWKDKVAEKGDAARIHFGIIAQDLQAAFAAEGLDAGDYAMFIHTTWWESTEVIPAVEAQEAVYETQTDEDGNEVQVLVSEAVEAQPERTVTHTHETQEEAPEGAVERDRMGVRYPELLAFIIAAM